MFFIEFSTLTAEQIDILTTHIKDKKNGLFHDVCESKDDGHFVVMVDDINFNDSVFVLNSIGLIPKLLHSN